MPYTGRGCVRFRVLPVPLRPRTQRFSQEPVPTQGEAPLRRPGRRGCQNSAMTTGLSIWRALFVAVSLYRARDHTPRRTLGCSGLGDADLCCTGTPSGGASGKAFLRFSWAAVAGGGCFHRQFLRFRIQLQSSFWNLAITYDLERKKSLPPHHRHLNPWRQNAKHLPQEPQRPEEPSPESIPLCCSLRSHPLFHQPFFFLAMPHSLLHLLLSSFLKHLLRKFFSCMALFF